jgi:hypothetical protein
LKNPPETLSRMSISSPDGSKRADPGRSRHFQ